MSCHHLDLVPKTDRNPKSTNSRFRRLKTIIEFPSLNDFNFEFERIQQLKVDKNDGNKKHKLRKKNTPTCPLPIGSMGRLHIYLHDLVDFYGVHVGKYTSPMDGKGYAGCE